MASAVLKKDWSLPDLLDGLHQGIEQRLQLTRAILQHPVMKGDASEAVWSEFLRQYLPRRYDISRAVVVDSKGVFSDNIDIVVHDRHFTPFILQYEGQTVLPAESVYAVFEAKQSLNSRNVEYAGKKALSVRKLHRTNQTVVHAQGRSRPRPLRPILAGILALDAGPQAFGNQVLRKLEDMEEQTTLDVGCVAAMGTFWRGSDGKYEVTLGKMPTTAFLFELVARLQEVATVPAIDMRAYSAWLE